MVFHKNLQSDKKQQAVFKRSILAMCIMAMGAPTFAQDTAKADENVEEVLVSGVRASLENAQDIKRNSSTVVDAISASDIGSLPDKSVLESLQRIPGIAIQRYAASTDPDHYSIEGSGITLRGLPETRSEFNGRDAFSANSGRGLGFQDVSPELMSKVEVYKSTAANLIEGGISGTVNLVTRKPFDASGQVAAFTITNDYADLAKKSKPSFSGLYSNVWDTGAGEFGFLISAAKSALDTRADGVSYGQVVDLNKPDDQPFVPKNAAIRTSNNFRERDALSLVGQWRNTDQTVEATLEYVRSKSSTGFVEHVLAEDNNTGSISADSVYEDGAFVAGTIQNVDVYHSTTRGKDNTSTVEDVSLNVKFTPTEKLTITTDLQYVTGLTEEFDVSLFAGVKASSKVDFRPERPTVTTLAPTDSTSGNLRYFSNPANYFWRAAMDHLDDSDGEELAGKVDVKYELDDSFIQSVEAGVRYSDREQTTRWSKYNWGNLSEKWAGGAKHFNGRVSDYSGVDTTHTGKSVGLYAYDVINMNSLMRSSQSGVEGGVLLAPAASFVESYANFRELTDSFGAMTDFANKHAGSRFKPNEINPITETNQAVYGQLNFADSDERLTGNIGVRLVKVSTEAVGGYVYPAAITNPILIAALPADDVTFSQNSTDPVPSTSTSSSNNVLPSLNVKYKLTDELQMRFAAGKAISFPSMGNMRNYGNFYSQQVNEVKGANDVLISADLIYKGSAGNPRLMPMEANNYEMSAEWYFANAGSVFGGVFYKDVTNYFASGATNTPITLNGITRNVLIEQPINQGNGTITGFEAGYQQFYDFLPAPFDGLGMQVNLTLLDQSGDVPNSNLDPAQPGGEQAINATFSNLPLQGLSETTYNIVAMYEKDDVSVRLAYNWRSEYLLTTKDVITALPIYAQPSGQLDASVFYTINDNFKIGLQGSNLLDELSWTKMQVNEEGKKIDRNFFVSDRRYSVVLKGTF